jgi:hypothetical protein
VLLRERENAVTLFVQMRGTFPVAQRLDIWQDLREFASRDRWTRRVVARQHWSGHRATPHKVTADAEHELAAHMFSPNVHSAVSSRSGRAARCSFDHSANESGK